MGVFAIFRYLVLILSAIAIEAGWNMFGGSVEPPKEASVVAISDNEDSTDLWQGWYPIDVSIRSGGGEATFHMCKLQHALHFAHPDENPMFKDLVKSSNCHRTTKMLSESALKTILVAEKANLIQPNGFVFHESRCGSTLVANMLTRYDESNLVYSESTPPSKILNHCNGCTAERKIELFKLAIHSVSSLLLIYSLGMVKGALTQRLVQIHTHTGPNPYTYIY
jgi:hypothetical protein